MLLLQKSMADVGSEGSAAICDKLIDSLAPGRDREDDATVLVLRVLGTGAVGRWSLLRTSSSVKTARTLVVDELGRLGVDDAEVVEVIELLTSEVVTNAVLHGEGSVELDVTRIDRFIRVSVSDEAVRLELGPAPVNVEASNGRGLLLVESLASTWGVDELPSGKRVWFEMQVTPDE
jgi:anti-sigma regulatory factor (Ser/Thr protein kinase)